MEDRGQDEEEGLLRHSSVGVGAGSESWPGGQATRWRRAGGDRGWSGEDAETGGGGDLGAGGRWQDLTSVDCDDR